MGIRGAKLKPIILLVLLAAAGTVGAQSANVIELDIVDSIRAERVWNQLQKAQKEWEQVREDVANKYVNTGKGYPLPRPGFESGFEFSKDFRFIVPKQELQPSGIYNNGCITLTPNTGPY